MMIIRQFEKATFTGHEYCDEAKFGDCDSHLRFAICEFSIYVIFPKVKHCKWKTDVKTVRSLNIQQLTI